MNNFRYIEIVVGIENSYRESIKKSKQQLSSNKNLKARFSIPIGI